ncbi:Lar family restriction alleviation protein [Dickeya poaceiphila]|nr:Lar family restriction alleviation protein [Dickeya poaceiphila]
MKDKDIQSRIDAAVELLKQAAPQMLAVKGPDGALVGPLKATEQLSAAEPVNKRDEFPAILPCDVELKPGLRIGKGCPISTLHLALKRRAEYLAMREYIKPAEHEAGVAAMRNFIRDCAPTTGKPLKDLEPDEIVELFGRKFRVDCRHDYHGRGETRFDFRRAEDGLSPICVTIGIDNDLGLVVSNHPGLPDGWKIVPVEPTEAMLLVLGMSGSLESMIARYHKMLAAAPLPDHSAKKVGADQFPDFTKMGNGLLPCPFCGSGDVEAFAQDKDDCPNMSAIVRCHNCNAQSAQMVGKNKISMASNSWNRRASEVNRGK